MADSWIRASITVSTVFGKHAVIRVVLTSEGCCTLTLSSLTAPSSHPHGGTGEELFSLLYTPVND